MLFLTIRGQFIVSINDRPEVWTLFKNFRIEDVATRCSANAKAAKRMGELLIYG